MNIKLYKINFFFGLVVLWANSLLNPIISFSFQIRFISFQVTEIIC
jgi:hypothetical protein